MHADLPDLTHRWLPADVDLYGIRWECADCLLASRVTFDAICPGRVLAWGNQRAEEARAATVAAVREAVLDLAPAETWSRVEARLRGITNGT